MCSLTEEQIQYYLQFKGSNNIDQPKLFFNQIIKLIDKKKWLAKDLKLLNRLIDDGFGYMLNLVFTHFEKSQKDHPPAGCYLWKKYYDKEHQLPPNINNLYKLSELFGKVKTSQEELANMELKINEFTQKE